MHRLKISIILMISVWSLIFGAASLAAAATDNTWRLTTLLDQPIRNMQDKELGEIEDLVIRRNGKVKKVIISLGGLLDVDDAETGIRFRALELGPDGTVRLDVTREELENKPRFNYQQNDLFTGYYIRPLPPGYAGRPPGRRARRYEPYPPRQGARDYMAYPSPAPYRYRPWYDYTYPPEPGPRSGRYWGAYQPMDWAYFPGRILGSSVLDRSLLNKNGEEVGSVQDLVIDSTKRVTQILVSTGGFLGIGDKVVAIPYRPLGFTYYGLVYDITEKQLENMSAYED